MDARPHKPEELRRQVEWTLARAVDPADALPMLHRLARIAADGSDECLFAHLHLAELLVERDPWRAALSARRVVSQRPDDDRGWATFALCHTLLGHYRFAVKAYHRALATAPQNPWYAHNLGHLLDVALDRSRDAIVWLELAHESERHSEEIASSYAHALARVGRLAEARKVLTRAMKRSASREHAALLKWIEQGAPAGKDHPLPRPAPAHAMAISFPDRSTRAGSRSASPSDRKSGAGRSPNAAALETTLLRGLANLPLDGKQRARAKALAEDSAHYFTPSNSRGAAATPAFLGAVAAAVAYAIVYVDHVPLTQSEIAACFRVGVASLRARFGELRVHLDLLPGDARYASLRSP